MLGFLHQFVNFPALPITWLTFCAAGMVTLAWQLRASSAERSLRGGLEHLFPARWWTSKSVRIDMQAYVIRKVTDKILPSVGLMVTLFTCDIVTRNISHFRADFQPVNAGIVILSVCALTMFVVGEFSDYVSHYMQHRLAFLWELHKVHHSALFLNPLTALRGHPLATVMSQATGGLMGGAAAGFFSFWFGMNLVDIFFLSAIATKIGSISTLDALKHSHFPIGFGWLEAFLISPHMHQVHHSRLPQHWDRNFGTNLSIFDWMFGTAYRAKKGEEISLGIYGMNEEEHDTYNNLFGFYVGSLGKMMSQPPYRLVGAVAGTASVEGGIVASQQIS